MGGEGGGGVPGAPCTPEQALPPLVARSVRLQPTPVCRMEEAKQVLQELLDDKRTHSKPLLILANKQDQQGPPLHPL